MLDSIKVTKHLPDGSGKDEPRLIGLRDCALISVMVYTFARIDAVLQVKEHEVPCHHHLEAYLDAYIAAAGIADDAEGPLFRTTRPLALSWCSDQQVS